jgi:ABC-type lipoprotein export system ATPase subunit
MAFLELNSVSKGYGPVQQRTEVLRNINLHIEKGEFVAIVGYSGAGKSTLISMIAGLIKPDVGSITLNDLEITAPGPDRGVVFQNYSLLPWLTVYENIETPLLYQDVKTSERKAMVADMLDRFRIVGKKDLFPSQLSGGQQQLVGIARALIAKPKLLLADEPTGNLNSAQGQEIMELFQKLHKEDGVTIIQATHSEKNAGYGERVIHLLDGAISKM